jgi:hypothetical protein
MSAVSRAVLSLILFTPWILLACSQVPVAGPPVPSGLLPGDRTVLAGEWEYEDGAAVRLLLDNRGHGAYDWKEGRFETTALNGHTWEGLWFQKENDREGGFVVELSPDYSEGEGRWWYTRIGSDHAPTEKGGTFHLSRITTEAHAREGAPAP